MSFKNNVFIETFGCQMNLNDTEIISSILNNNGFAIINEIEHADIILLNTCSVRDNAERKIRERLIHLKQYKNKNKSIIIGIIGCMAERLKDELFNNNLVNLVVGPDEYRNIDLLLKQTIQGIKAIAVNLSLTETYDDIIPYRTNDLSAWLSIMRGCNNFCSYCVVPYTRGRERSRSYLSILNEINELANNGYKEITLLGQNVNSYYDMSNKIDFPDLLYKCAQTAPNIRFRFTTSHPLDISDKLIEVIANTSNICNHVHLPVQSGSNNILAKMNRKYTREHYLNRVDLIYSKINNCSITTDIIVGFPGETEQDFLDTISLMNIVKYDGAFMFKYSPRENTKAFNMIDDISEEVKLQRLNEIIKIQHDISKKRNQQEIGNAYEVLVESSSKRKKNEWQGRTDTNKVVIFPINNCIDRGSLIKVNITGFTSATLFGEIIN